MRRRRKNATAWPGMFGQFYERMHPKESPWGDSSTKWITKDGKPYRAHYKSRRRRRKISMATTRTSRRRYRRSAGYRALRRRSLARYRAIHRRRRRAVSGRRRLTGFVSVKRRTFRLRRRSPFKRRLRGFRINPGVAEYLMNPRRRRHSRRHRGGYRHNPVSASGVIGSMRGVLDFGAIKYGAVATGGAASTIVVGNLVRSYVLPYLPAQISSGYFGTVITAAVRAASAWALDKYVVGMITKDRSAFRAGAAIGIFGSAILELIGTSLTIGAGDTSQTYHQFVPAALAGYVRAPGLVAAYQRKSPMMLAGRAAGVGDLAGIGSSGHERLYGAR